MKKLYIECGKIIAPHGVRGLVKVDSWCDTPKILATRKRVFIKRGEEYCERTVLAASSAANTVIMNIGLATREEAQAMKGEVLYLDRADIPLPDGAVLIADMIGLPVYDVESGKLYGTLSEVTDVPRGKLYTIKTEKGDVLFPEHPEFVKKIDVESGIYIKVIPGFFD
jgi:16S rRNA processing protein RimM